MRVSLPMVTRGLPPLFFASTVATASPTLYARSASRPAFTTPQVSEPYPGRWTHHLVIGSVEEIDDELMDWVREAYEYARSASRPAFTTPRMPSVPNNLPMSIHLKFSTLCF